MAKGAYKMMIIGVDNTFHLGNETIFLLKSVANEAQIAYIHLVASSEGSRERRLLKGLIDIIMKDKEIKLCIIEFSRHNLENLKAIHFDGIVFFDEHIGYKRYYNHHIYWIKNRLKAIASCTTFILPDTTRCRLNKDISYGWSKVAHISLTSSEEVMEGNLEVQCILQHPTIAINGDFTTPREFGVSGKARYPEQILAVVAVFVLYGFDFNKTRYNLE